MWVRVSCRLRPLMIVLPSILTQTHAMVLSFSVVASIEISYLQRSVFVHVCGQLAAQLIQILYISFTATGKFVNAVQ